MKCYIKVFCITLLIQLSGLAMGLLFGDELMNEKLSSGVFLFVYVAGFLIALDDVPFWNPMSFLETNAAFFYVIGLMVFLSCGNCFGLSLGKRQERKADKFLFDADQYGSGWNVYLLCLVCYLVFDYACEAFYLKYIDKPRPL